MREAFRGIFITKNRAGSTNEVRVPIELSQTCVRETIRITVRLIKRFGREAFFSINFITNIKFYFDNVINMIILFKNRKGVIPVIATRMSCPNFPCSD